MNAFTTGNPFWGTILLEISVGRGFMGSEGVDVMVFPLGV